MMFRVWDLLNSEESEAREVEADNAEEAARLFGEQDHDGWTDGLYYENAHDIAVVAPDGTRSIVSVEAEMVPFFRSTTISTVAPGGDGPK